jgi:hypothetical protein
MVVIERSPDQSVQIGPYTLRVLAVRAGEVVVALLDPATDCISCGERGSARRCRVCDVEVLLCPGCVDSWRCPRCACTVA